MTEYSRQESYKFPDSNSLTSTDEKYFEMIQNETDLGGKQGNFTFSYSQKRDDMVIRIDQHGAPDSNSLTEADREYFNIIKTEDGLSEFYKTKIDPDYILDSLVTGQAGQVHTFDSPPRDNDPDNDNKVLISDMHPVFKYHLVTMGNKNNEGKKKRIVGLYLPDHK